MMKKNITHKAQARSSVKEDAGDLEYVNVDIC